MPHAFNGSRRALVSDLTLKSLRQPLQQGLGLAGWCGTWSCSRGMTPGPTLLHKPRLCEGGVREYLHSLNEADAFTVVLS